MSNEAQHLLNHIQYKTGKTLDQIALDIGYSRPYLNKVKLKGKDGGKIVGILKSKYINELKDVPRFDSIASQLQNKAEPTLLEALVLELTSLSRLTHKILQEQKDEVVEKIKKMDANLDAVVAQTEKLDYEVESGRTTILRALSRLENKQEDQLVHEADMLKRVMAKARDELYNSPKSSQNTGKHQQKG